MLKGAGQTSAIVLVGDGGSVGFGVGVEVGVGVGVGLLLPMGLLHADNISKSIIRVGRIGLRRIRSAFCLSL